MKLDQIFDHPHHWHFSGPCLVQSKLSLIHISSDHLLFATDVPSVHVDARNCSAHMRDENSNSLVDLHQPIHCRSRPLPWQLANSYSSHTLEIAVKKLCLQWGSEECHLLTGSVSSKSHIEMSVALFAIVINLSLLYIHTRKSWISNPNSHYNKPIFTLN